MRFRHPDGSTVHLAYCTNVHPAETLDGVVAQLREHCEPVRKRLGRDRLGIGLWLARDAARTLAGDPAALRGLRSALDRRGLEVVTLNGFPYEGFGAQEVKYRVYKPDWTDPERLSYTTTLARLLAALLPDDVTEGSISTLPLAWRTPYDRHPTAATTARTALTTLAERLDALEELTGKSIRIGLEPEPGCTIETTADTIGPLTTLASPRIGICVDTCHLATSFEDPATALSALTTANIPIAKAQLSAALHAEDPQLPEVRTALSHFAEPRFLHQTRTPTHPPAKPAAHLGAATDAGPGAATGARPASATGARPAAAADAHPAVSATTHPAVAATPCFPGTTEADPPVTVDARPAVAAPACIAEAATPHPPAQTEPPVATTTLPPVATTRPPDPNPAQVPAALEVPRHPTAPALPPNPPLHTLLGTDDLPEALTTTALPTTTPWRAHFHVPLHTSPAPPLTSTLAVLQDALTHLMAHPSGHPLTPHLEVETYTWQALPPELRPRSRAQLADGIAAELALARDLLTDLGLKELP
ncbi:metabolite traffic protein EboE [Streptomyces sp. NPDC054863]